MEDKLHRPINILPVEVYQQLSIIMPLEKWKYHNLKSQVLDMININYRFQAQESISHGKSHGLFQMESTGDGSDNAESEEPWGYDVNTYEPVNLIQHVQAGCVGFDDEWNVYSEYTINALEIKEKEEKRAARKEGAIPPK